MERILNGNARPIVNRGSQVSNQRKLGQLIDQTANPIRAQTLVSDVLHGRGTRPDRRKVAAVLIEFLLLQLSGVDPSELLRIHNSDAISGFQDTAAPRKSTGTGKAYNPHFRKFCEAMWDKHPDKQLKNAEKEQIATAT